MAHSSVFGIVGNKLCRRENNHTNMSFIVSDSRGKLLLAYFTATVAATVGPAYIRLMQLSAGGAIGSEQRKKCSPSLCSDSSDISDSVSVPKAQNRSENR